jgi:nucleoporin NUP82
MPLYAQKRVSLPFPPCGATSQCIRRSIPSSYVHALDCFISAKQEFLSQGTSSGTSALSTLYDYQRKYVTALLKQLPLGTVYPAISRSFPMHPPTTIKSQPMRQGPFLLQPSPRSLEGSEGGDATDIMYLAFVRDDDDDDADAGETERLGIVIVTYQDGKVDVCLDVEKVEARWESKQVCEQICLQRSCSCMFFRISLRTCPC